jgi:flagellar hook-associated protein 3 FlgL
VSQLSALRGQVGATGERLNTITDSQQSTATYLDDIVSRIEDADVPQTMTQLAQDQANLEAAYLTTSRLSQLTLADYLR